MGRVLKWLAIVVVVVVVVVIGGMAVALMLLDPNDYRDDITAVVERQTGRTLTIGGDLSLTFFPRLGVTAEEVQLADAPGFGDKPFLTVDEVTLAVASWPLLQGELQLDTIVLRQPEVRLVRNAQGEANWEQFSPPAKSAAAAHVVPVGLTEMQQNNDEALLPAMVRDAQLAGVRMIDARVRYIDRGAGSEVTVSPLNLSLDDVRFGAPVPVDANWEAQLPGGLAAVGSFDGKARVDADLKTARFDDLNLKLTVSGDAVPAGEQTVTVQAGVAADIAGGVYRLRDLVVEAANARLEGQAEARTHAGGMVIASSLTLPKTNPREMLDALAITIPKTRDANTLDQLAAETELRFADGVLRVKPLSLTLDDSHLEGKASVRDFANPAIGFDLSVDQLDADRYMPPASEGDQPGATPGGATAKGVGDIPVETLRGLDVDGRLKIGKLTVAGADLSHVQVVVKAADGSIRVHPLAAELYGGRYQGDVRVDATGDEPTFKVNEHLTGVQAGPLLTDFADFSKLLGSANLSLQASTRGDNTDALISALNGSAKFEFLKGAIKGFNIAQMLRQGMARLQGQSVTAGDEPQQTDFSSITGTLQLDGATVRNKDFTAKTPLLRITGSGDANLQKQSVDYRLTVNVVDTLKGQGGEQLTELKSVPVPLRISGPFADPEIALALDEALKGVVKARVEEKRGELKEKLSSKLREKLGGGDAEKATEGSSGKSKPPKAQKSGDKDQLEDELKDKAKDKLKGLFGG